MLDSNQAIYGLIANGDGWALSTLLGFQRALRYQDQVDLHPLPFKDLCREVSLYYREDRMPEIAAIIADHLRGILQTTVIEPGRASAPWLGDSLLILEG